MSDLVLKCYCCGEVVSGEFALVTMSHDEADRVFIMRPSCSKKGDAVRIMIVKKATP